VNRRAGTRSYSWARHVETSEVNLDSLSEAAAAGLEDAQDLADNAYARSTEPRPDMQPPKLTTADIAEVRGISTATVRDRIALARRQLFGTVTDAAIAKRAQRQRKRHRRTCAHPHCAAQISVAAHGNRRYCQSHATGAARARRHRTQRAAASPPAD
jgi:hypothetical protein